jgi:hypothetical protein
MTVFIKEIKVFLVKMVKKWDYAKREGDRAFCDLCDGDGNNEYSCVGGTTGS